MLTMEDSTNIPSAAIKEVLADNALAYFTVILLTPSERGQSVAFDHGL